MTPESSPDHAGNQFRADAHMLIVEDEIDIAMNLRDLLALCGYSAVLAHNPDDALQEFRRKPPDLVLMDVNLNSETDGIDTVEKMRAESGYVPVVFVTAYGDNATVDRANFAEPLGYLVKPFEAREVLATVRISLSNSRRQREFRRKAARFDTTSELLDDALVFVDTNGKVRSINARAESLTGVGPGGAVGSELGSLLKVVDSTQREITADLMKKAFETGQSAEVSEHASLLSTEGEIPVSLVILPDLDQQEAVVRVHKLDPVPKNPDTNGKYTAIPSAAADRDTEILEAKNVHAAALILNHLGAFHTRYGASVVEEITLAYEQHVAQMLEDGWALCRWKQGVLALVYWEPAALKEIQREIYHLSAKPLVYELQTARRSVLLHITARAVLLAPDPDRVLSDRIATALPSMTGEGGAGPG